MVVKEEEFQHILRILNTNVEGGKPAPIALTKIRGIGKRFATLICRKAEIDIRKRYLFIYLFINNYANNRDLFILFICHQKNKYDLKYI